ncbi:hypothetical protein HK102_008632, partial [Quaeritorhiza haematococci]
MDNPVSQALYSLGFPDVSTASSAPTINTTTSTANTITTPTNAFPPDLLLGMGIPTSTLGTAATTSPHIASLLPSSAAVPAPISPTVAVSGSNPFPIPSRHHSAGPAAPPPHALRIPMGLTIPPPPSSSSAFISALGHPPPGPPTGPPSPFHAVPYPNPISPVTAQVPQLVQHPLARPPPMHPLSHQHQQPSPHAPQPHAQGMLVPGAKINIPNGISPVTLGNT